MADFSLMIYARFVVPFVQSTAFKKKKINKNSNCEIVVQF